MKCIFNCFNGLGLVMLKSYELTQNKKAPTCVGTFSFWLG
nr:MAG TPA: hypothetical protein [Caudoviricetes sp.]